MKKGFKKYFIPHEGNDHKPYFLREKSVMVVGTVIVVLLFASLLGSYVVKNTRFLAAIQSAFLVDLANEDRIDQGSQKLVINERLVSAAQMKADDMAKKSYFAHTSPEGVTPWHWFSEAGYEYIYAGENLAVNFNRSEDVEKAWMDSPLHRANILNNRYKEIGIATAEGTYKGKKTTFVVQMFGTPTANMKKKDVGVALNTPTSSPRETEVAVVSSTLNSEALGVSSTNKTSVEENKTISEATQPKEIVVQNTLPVEEEVIEQETFLETENPLYQNNNLADTEAVSVEAVKGSSYTNWFERFLVNPGEAVNKAYVTLFVLILFSLILKIFVAIRKQYPKNIAYGVLLLVLVLIFMHINQEMFIDPIVAAVS